MSEMTKEEVFNFLQGKWATFHEDFLMEFSGNELTQTEKGNSEKTKIDLKWNQKLNHWEVLHSSFFSSTAIISQLHEDTFRFVVDVSPNSNAVEPINYFLFRRKEIL